MSFFRQKSSTNTKNNEDNSSRYYGSKVVYAMLDINFTQKLSMLINDSIREYTSNNSRGVMCRSMHVDLPRMDYYIDNHMISIPGNIEASYNKFIEQGGKEWANDYVGSISAFLHQGIFVDIFKAIPYWKDSNECRWDIIMASHDRLNCSNTFHINKDGSIKIISQSHVSNIILNDNNIVLTKSSKSFFSLQISLVCVKNIGGHCLVMTAGDSTDRATLQLEFEDIDK
ncbi:hypothetical protein [Yersinia thracica]|uniref:hypothetical protein n=1 Tax=Yersinia thracica TaxID=2890319 RepID=UPI00157D94EE|nr:hypothetical protein [Yersinia thracica]